MRLVLDTNVWLDWFIFEDAAVNPVKAAVRENKIEIVIDNPCRDELIRVLAYPKFHLDGDTQTNILKAADALSTLLCNLNYVPAGTLPACKDPDDIKFLALAASSQADWLLTKDNALLSTRRKKKPVSTSYQIGTPEQWTKYELTNTILSG